jgi:hypothetical protein
MLSMKIIPVILSGGSGSRLWPLSRELYPKQFLPLITENSLFQETITRCRTIANVVVEDPVVVCNEEHRFIVAEQMRDQGICPSGILLEPVGRNTAPAVAVAAQYLSAKYKRADDDLLLLVLPADHVIENANAFVCAVEKHSQSNTRSAGNTNNNKSSSARLYLALKYCAATATAGAVLRPTGSNKIPEGQIPWSRICSATINRCSSLHTTTGSSTTTLAIVRQRVMVS